MAKKQRIRATVVTITMALAASVSSVGSAQAAEVEYWAGKDVILGACKGWLNKRTSDGYVQAVVQSWGDECAMWLERKRLGTNGYDWTRVSNRVVIISSQYKTGFHWNGTDAASRVCITHNTTGREDCGLAAW
ncbi:hypothetical protein [Streptomyces prasinus]|uniref:hypothetical protein n=1 Tax=Streptomyces prasinus TaxID=67345 RepID=UPI0033B37579